MKKIQEKMRLLPGIDRLLGAAEEAFEEDFVSRGLLVQILRQVVEDVRTRIKLGEDPDLGIDSLLRTVEMKIRQRKMNSLRRVINGTGVVLHTNLGRAPMGLRAKQAVADVMDGYSTLEYRVETGERGSRYDHLVQRLCELTGAEDALAVNNNAAAVLLVLSSMARDREVIVSRGQLVEIGGSFRVPDVLRQSGARLVEVGTTNKTHLYDYERAITVDTAAILKVHTSNYRIIGFTSQPEDEALVAMAHEKGIPVIDDLGSGTLLPVSVEDWSEPTVSQRIQAGVDVVTFSGDKLLGAGQAGIIAGKRAYIEKMKKHPLLRAIRMDKLSIAALEGTLMDYELGNPLEDVPVQRMLHISSDTLHEEALELEGLLAPLRELGWQVEVREMISQAGGGSLPTLGLAGWGVAIIPKGISVAELERRLRIRRTPIITRVQNDILQIDVRCISRRDMKDIQDACMEIGKGVRQ